MRKKTSILSEEEAMQDVLRAEKEPILRGDLRELIKNCICQKKEAVLPSIGDHEVYDK